MKKADRKKIQTEIIQSLLDWSFAEKGFEFDRKGYNIFNDRIQIPFYESTTLGPYWTIDPQINMTDKNLCEDILKIIQKEPFLTNAYFNFSPILNSYLGHNSVNALLQENTHCSLVYGKYQFEIYAEVDAEWIIEWYKIYFDVVGWDFIELLSDDYKFYDFCRVGFCNLVTRKENISKLNIENLIQPQNSFVSIEYYALITSIYLGLKNNYTGINEYAEIALEHYKNGSYYRDPINKLVDHFIEQPHFY